jgi:hypothetical protein
MSEFNVRLGVALSIATFPITIPILLGAWFGAQYLLKRIFKLAKTEILVTTAFVVFLAYLCWCYLLATHAPRF